MSLSSLADTCPLAPPADDAPVSLRVEKAAAMPADADREEALVEDIEQSLLLIIVTSALLVGGGLLRVSSLRGAFAHETATILTVLGCAAGGVTMVYVARSMRSLRRVLAGSVADR